VVGKTRCKVARRMAQWAASRDDEQHQGVGGSNTPINQNGPSSNDEIPHPLMDCGQGKNMSDEGGVGVDEAGCVGVDVARKKDGEQTSDGEDDTTGTNSAEDGQKSVAGVNYLIAGAPHPINMPLRLHTCESIPPPPHGATPPINKPLRLRTCESIPPPPQGATSPSGGSKSVRFATPPPHGATPPLGDSKSVRLASPPPYGAIPPSSGTMTVNQKSGTQPPPNGVFVPHATRALEGLRPQILEQTGGLLTGAETDKLRLQNRRRCHALQEKQVPTTLWSTHMGHASLPPQQERPLEYHNEMCPAGIATTHPAEELLSEWSKMGCPTKTGRLWSKE